MGADHRDADGAEELDNDRPSCPAFRGIPRTSFSAGTGGRTCFSRTRTAGRTWAGCGDTGGGTAGELCLAGTPADAAKRRRTQSLAGCTACDSPLLLPHEVGGHTPQLNPEVPVPFVHLIAYVAVGNRPGGPHISLVYAVDHPADPLGDGLPLSGARWRGERRRVAHLRRPRH